MAKKRKTRDQKKLADLRHNFSHSYSPSYTTPKTLNTLINTKIEAKTTVINRNEYPFLKKDLSKTALLTLSILLFQTLLFLSLKNHIFMIPGINY